MTRPQVRVHASFGNIHENHFQPEKEGEMRSAVRGFIIILALVVPSFVGGCSYYTPPSDEDIIKAIDDSGIMQGTEKFTVVPPAVVVSKDKKNKDGSWPVKVKFTIVVKMSDGRNSPPTETTTSFKIFRAKDGTGKSVWKARLES